ncbi:succinate dehydrogenase, hydrophobic membrane anchor protein [Aurantiacibacter spongiae]|uniref:Succinate dehydrogenase hydrophobic membrane anchor subunit n=1 Tax=Aurantiacibacter spongiae TaxID=2488860 RepID=A0A3N5CQA6_9SPHN|nr:succinate dehydrogenase, hydrophobic membrane anchor protein [Aurantiacibacter spongiae]RPF70556.1 succinate dehydrogenase, hydrophobic membrane anchor protein [Aurantiacibacter spongiae]
MGRNTTLERAGGKGTAIGQVRGLGSSHEGPHHWMLQRFTAIGNLVTVVFLGLSLAFLPDRSYASVSGWLGEPLPAFMIALLVISTFWHARLGLQVMIEDYVDSPGNKFAAVTLLNLVAVAGAAFGLFCLARLAFAGAA